MRSFRIKILVFVLAAIFIVTAETTIINKLVTSKANFNLDKQYEYIIIGHSHPECAFDDSLITNFKNLSESGESYFYAYQKLQQVLDQNPHVKSVFFEFTNNMTFQSIDEWTWKDKYLSYRLPIYQPFLTPKEHFFLLSKNPNGYIRNLALSNKENLAQVVRSNFSYQNKIGGYNKLFRYKTDSLIQTFDRSTNKYFKNNPVSITNLNYLKKCVALSLGMNKKVYFIRSPQHDIIKSEKGEAAFQQIRKEHFPNIPFLDFNDFPLKDTQFGDLEHLNFEGASIFSNWFQSLIEKGLLESDDTEAFIKNHLKKSAI